MTDSTKICIRTGLPSYKKESSHPDEFEKQVYYKIIYISDLKKPSAGTPSNKRVGRQGQKAYRHCPYCPCYDTRYLRNHMRKHKNIPEVQKFLSMPNGEKKDKEFARIRKKGTLKWNRENLGKPGFSEIRTERLVLLLVIFLTKNIK